MNVVNLILGVLFIILGFLSVYYYLSLKKEGKHGGLSKHYIGSGVGAIMIGIYYIYNEIKHLF